jgi:hypothetical protein
MDRMNTRARMLMPLIASVMLLAASPARADTRVTVHDFYGPNAARMREQVVAVLEDKGLKVVDTPEIERAAAKLKVDRFSPDGRQALAKELGLAAWMTGLLQKKKGKLTLTLVVYDGGQRGRLARTRFVASNARQLGEAVKGRLWDKTGRALLELEAPAGESSPQVEVAAAPSTRDSAPRTAAESESDRDAARGEALRVFVGVGSPFRSLSYEDPITAGLGDYRLSAAPVADLAVSFFPGRFATQGPLSWFGIEARGQLGLSSPTLNQGGNEFKSRYDALHAGVRARVPLGAHHISAFSGYSLSRFAIKSEADGITAPTPSVDYRSIRSGVGAELALSDSMRVAFDAAWLNYLSVGEIARWFPRATAAGVELSLASTYRVTGNIFTRVAAVYSRAFFDFNAQPGDKYIAGGALDQSLALALGVGMQL